MRGSVSGPDAPLRVLYVGSLEDGGTAKQRLRALLDLGHTVSEVDTQLLDVRRSLVDRATRRVVRSFQAVSRHADVAGVNRRLIDQCRRSPCDVIWIDKGMTIEAETMELLKREQPGCVVVGYSPDDMGSAHCQSRQFLEHLPFYDLFLTTKTYNVSELQRLGCPRVQFIGNAYDPHTHRPVTLSPDEQVTFRASVGFVGTREKERLGFLQRLARDGVAVHVWGGEWRSSDRTHTNLSIEPKLLWGDLYAKAIAGIEINLCFLRKANRDRQTTRSVEIPACGKFMLAERTDEHLALFAEGTEAEFFDGYDEMLEKIRFYEKQPDLCRRIGLAGRARCLRSGYSNHERLRAVLASVVSARASV